MPSENLLEAEDLNIIKDIKSSLSEKIANPFIASFITSWIVSNSSLVYSFFYFDNNLSLEKRLAYFNHYWKENSFVTSLFSASLHALVIILCLYLFSSVARYFSYLFYNRIVPFLKKVTGKKIITKEEFDYLQLKLIKKENEIDAMVMLSQKTQDENEKLQKLIYDNSTKYTSELSTITNKLGDNEKKFDNLEKSLDGLEKENRKINTVWTLLSALNKLTNKELTVYYTDIKSTRTIEDWESMINSNYVHILNDILPSTFISSSLIQGIEIEYELIYTENFKREISKLLENGIITSITQARTGYRYFSIASKDWSDSTIIFEYQRRIKLAKDLEL